MNIGQAKQEIENTVRAYTKKKLTELTPYRLCTSVRCF